MQNNTEKFYENAGISPEVYAFGEKILGELKPRFDTIEKTAENNQLKVLSAMQKNRVSAECFYGSTGYGYNDYGRDVIERVYADAFDAEDALVRPQITCGTHAIALSLFSNLRPGDELVSISGRPYDTLEEVIGIRTSRGSLAEYGVTYAQVDLKDGKYFDYDAIQKAITHKTKMVAIQRSKGYSSRLSIPVDKIEDAVAFVKNINSNILVMVDNCYGEFVEEKEPTTVGADIMAGSLIKNPGGGLCPTGGYLAGTRECIENAAARLTSPGLGREVGPSLGLMRDYFQGFFMAPTVTASAMKTALFAAKAYEELGYNVIPSSVEKRTDIIQAVTLGSADALCAFCRGIQKAAPVDSFVTPEPWDMPGYEDDVIMAAGTFVQGSSIELSADGPLREPYNAYFQGGITFYHGKYGILSSIQSLCDAGLLVI